MNLFECSTVLAVFAHPDDETLAAGATIARLCDAGVDVHVAIPATGIQSRRNVQDPKTMEADLAELRKDCEAAMSILGIQRDHIHLGDFPDNEMDKRSLLELIHWVEGIVTKVKPQCILTHHRYCTNIDHQYCHEAVVVATRPGLDSHVSVLCGEVPSSTGYLRPVQWEPNFYVEVSETDLAKKVGAMEAYKGEARPDPHPRSRQVLNALAKVRGSEGGVYFAEAFMIQRTFAIRTSVR